MSPSKSLLIVLLFLIGIVAGAAQQKDGVLLVRLTSVEKKVDALKKAGFQTRATEEIAANDKFNKNLIENFSIFYTCSDYYFYNAENAKLIKKGIFDNNLLDINGEPVDPDLKNLNIYVAEYGEGSPHDSTEDYIGKGFVIRKLADGEFQRVQNRKSYAGSGSGFLKPEKKFRRSVIKLNKKIYKMGLFKKA